MILCHRIGSESQSVSHQRLTDFRNRYHFESNELSPHSEVFPPDRLPFRQLFKRSGDQIAQQAEKEVGLRMNTEFGVPVLEEQTGIVWLKFQLDEREGQRVEGLTAHYYVDGYILQFSAGTTVTRGKEDWPVLEGILRSIKIPSH